MRRLVVTLMGVIVVWLGIAALYVAEAAEDYGLLGHVRWYSHPKAPVTHWLLDVTVIIIVVIAYLLGRWAQREELR